MRNFIIALAAAIAGVSVSVAGTSARQDTGAAGEARVTQAVAVLAPTRGSDARGVVTFARVTDGIRVRGEVVGLSPGKHGFHVHEYGDLRAPDGTSAGGHFNPTDRRHNARTASDRHVGDLGNIEADAEGRAAFDFVDHVLSFEGPACILGRGLVVHEGADDLESQPSGDAGARLAIGVIGVANPDEEQ